MLELAGWKNGNFKNQLQLFVFSTDARSNRLTSSQICHILTLHARCTAYMRSSLLEKLYLAAYVRYLIYQDWLRHSFRHVGWNEDVLLQHFNCVDTLYGWRIYVRFSTSLDHDGSQFTPEFMIISLIAGFTAIYFLAAYLRNTFYDSNVWKESKENSVEGLDLCKKKNKVHNEETAMSCAHCFITPFITCHHTKYTVAISFEINHRLNFIRRTSFLEVALISFLLFVAFYRWCRKAQPFHRYW